MFGLLGVAVLMSAATVASAADNEKYRPKLFLDLPEYCNTPDGMTLDRDNNIFLSCPNFCNPEYPGVIVKITPQNQMSIFLPCPAHPDTRRACPMGLAIGPDGNIYYADNQYFNDKNYKSRLMRVVLKDGRPWRAEVVVDGFKLANAVAWKGDFVHVTDTFFDLPNPPPTSGVFRIGLDEMRHGTIHLKPGLVDPHLLATFHTTRPKRNDLAGADGMTFDSQGNLYTGNFGDGNFSKVTFGPDGKVTSNKLVSTTLSCVDGIFYDRKRDKIYIADSEKNAIQVYDVKTGVITTLWENDDTDGSNGLLDQPCEVVIRGNEMVIANFDMPFPGLRNSKYDSSHTLSVIRLDP
jgi:sugar lactone lactonase YvrE